MGHVDRSVALLTGLAAQRRARLRHPSDPDLAAAEALLLDELGPGVSQGIAARFLGFSQPAIARWVDSGDLPAAMAPDGRWVIPVGPLLRLESEVRHARADGHRHALEIVFRRDRERARTMHVADGAWPDAHRHERASRRALEYHRALADRLSDADVLDARSTLERWRRAGRIEPRYAAAWAALLDGPREDIRAAMVAEDQHGADLRQNSPFAGLLSEAERHRILELVR